MSAPSDTGAEVRGLGRRAAMPLILAGVVLMGFFGGFGYWAATAPLAGAAVATGTVSTENSRRTVEHLEGGVIERILVRDGQVVAAGEPLVILDDTRARAQVDTQDIAILTLEAQLFRLRAERAACRAGRGRQPGVSGRFRRARGRARKGRGDPRPGTDPL
ncbi:MAG: biotin/lipoyl-binding protein [Paracoccaceae bacterium]